MAGPFWLALPLVGGGIVLCVLSSLLLFLCFQSRVQVNSVKLF